VPGGRSNPQGWVLAPGHETSGQLRYAAMRSAPVAQGIEQWFPKPCAAGSNPAGGTPTSAGLASLFYASGRPSRFPADDYGSAVRRVSTSPRSFRSGIARLTVPTETLWESARSCA
jgi:hypothetical protein